MEFTQQEDSFVHYDQNGEIDAQINFEQNREQHTLTVTRTYVSPALRGQGIAKQLAQRVKAYCCQEELQLKSTCSYITKLIETNRL